MRPGSQLRPGSQRMQVAGMGPSLQQPITVNADAPVAREGMRTASRGPGTSAGPGRQVGDRSYYIGLLRPKIADLATEIERLTEQEQLIEKNSGVLVQLEQKSNELTSQIEKLKGDLADVNMAVDNAANQREIRLIREEYAALERVNVEQRKEVDKLFLEVRGSEAKTQKELEDLQEEMQQLEKKLMNENQDFNQFKSVRDEAFAISDKVLEQQHQMRMLSAKRELLIASLKKNPDKKKASELLLSILSKRKEKAEITKTCSLSVEEEKQMMIQQIKSTRLDIEVLERQVNDTRDALQESKMRHTSLESDLRELSGNDSQMLKKLLGKQQEMQKFIHDYPEMEREEWAKVSALQGNINMLLERISQALELQRQIPTENSPPAMQTLATEVDARREQLQTEQETHQRIQKELMERKAELEKVTDLDRKIKEELESHARIMAERRAETEKFSDIGRLKDDVNAMRQDLEAQRKYLTRVRDYGRKFLLSAAEEVDKQKKSIEVDSVYRTLISSEEKLRALWQSSYAMEEFVRLKEKETHYLTSKAECLRLVDDINLRLKDPAVLTTTVGPRMTNMME